MTNATYRKFSKRQYLLEKILVLLMINNRLRELSINYVCYVIC